MSRPGFGAWTRIETGSAADFAAATVIVDEERDRALLLGGIGFSAGGPPVPLNTIYTLDLENPAEGPILTGSTLPAPAFLGMAIADVARDRAIYALGGSLLSGEPSAAMYSLDLETLAASEVTQAGSPPVAGFNGSMTVDPYTPDRIVTGTSATPAWSSTAA